MFKEIHETIVEVFKPIVDVPTFVANRDKPIDLITLVAANFGTSKDMDKYIKVVMEGDFIYLLYDGLVEEKGSLISYDNLMYHGKVYQITLVDYNTAMVDRDPEKPLSMLLLLSVCAVTFEKAKHSSLMYTSTNKLSFLFDHAMPFVYLAVSLSIFDDTEELRSGLLNAMKTVKLEQFNSLNKDILDAYLKLIKENGISLLLDCSLIASVVGDDTKEDKNEKASV